MLGFVLTKSAARKLEPVDDLPQHFTFFDASSESLTLIGVDITRENSYQGLPGVRVCVCVCAYCHGELFGTILQSSSGQALPGGASGSGEPACCLLMLSLAPVRFSYKVIGDAKGF